MKMKSAESLIGRDTMGTKGNEWVTHRFEVKDDVRGKIGEEWLLSNGTGAYSSGTVIGCNTRRYHGLLCACKRPPVGRELLVSQMIEHLDLRKKNEACETLEFTTCEFRDEEGDATVFAPQGLHMLEKF